MFAVFFMFKPDINNKWNKRQKTKMPSSRRIEIAKSVIWAVMLFSEILDLGNIDICHIKTEQQFINTCITIMNNDSDNALHEIVSYIFN